jgi:hypothetical protein
MKPTDNGIDYLQSQHTEEFERESRELRRYDRGLREIPPKIEREEVLFYTRRKDETAAEAVKRAIEAIENYQEMRTR